MVVAPYMRHDYTGKKISIVRVEALVLNRLMFNNYSRRIGI